MSAPPLVPSFVAFAMALLVGWIATLAAARAARHFQLMDRNEGRNLVGYRPIPRIGGAALALAVVLGCLSGATASGKSSWQVLLGSGGVWIAAGLVFVVGLLDDVRSVPARYKLMTLVGAGALVTLAGFRVQHLPLLHWPLGPAASVFFTIACFAAIATAWNFIDGLDGLAAGFTALAALAYSLDGAAHTGLLIAPAVAGAALGFLAHNRPPASIFMGDSGSLFLGFWVAFLSLAPHAHGVGHQRSIPRLIVLLWPLLDLGLALFRRLGHRALFVASGDHLHYMLAARLGHRRTVLVALVATALLATGFISLGSPWRSAGLAMALGAIVICLFCARVRTQPALLAVCIGLLAYMPTTLADSRARTPIPIPAQPRARAERFPIAPIRLFPGVSAMVHEELPSGASAQVVQKCRRRERSVRASCPLVRRVRSTESAGGL